MTDYRPLLAELAVPRLVGTPSHDRVRDALKRELGARQFVVMEQRFAATPYRLLAVQVWATALAAAGPAALLAFWLTAFWSRSTRFGIAAAVVAFGLLAIVASGIAAKARRSLMPLEACNLIAVRPRRRVRVWLAAHYDSKGQDLSMATRLLGVGLCAIGLAGFVGCGAAVAFQARGDGAAIWWFVVPGVVGGLMLRRSAPTERSAGALDNASGVIAALAVADALPQADIGVLLTDAEEFGLLGAEALVRERANLLQDTAVVNFDGIDDRGRVTAVIHRAGGTVAAVARALGARRMAWVPVVVDGMALAGAARECLTIMKGDWQTMRVVHTEQDRADRLALTGVEEVARAVARAIAGRGEAG